MHHVNISIISCALYIIVHHCIGFDFVISFKGRDAAYTPKLLGIENLKNPKCLGQARIGIRAG